MMTFLYVEPREVRHEALIRVRDLQKWTDLGLSGETITPSQQARIKDQARAFFATRNPLKIDNIAAKSVSSRAEFLNISLTGLQVIEGEKPLDLSTAIIGIILSYPVKHLPKHVAVRWDLFNERVARIPATAIDPTGPLLNFVSASDPTLEWRNYLLKYQEPEVLPVVLDDGRSIGIPLLSAVLLIFAFGATLLAFRPTLLSRRSWAVISVSSAVVAALMIRMAVLDFDIPFAGPPDKKASARILTGILSNVNHAFIEKNEAALRKALGVIVVKKQLDDVETELRRALAIKVAGGGIALVRAIEKLAVKEIVALRGAAGFRAVAEWTAKASAGHWGHAHRRTIRFRALIEVVKVKGAWKLAGITVVNAKQES
jgi:hypothetical protein